MKKKLVVIAALLAAALLLVSCGSKENKEFTAKDIEGRWTISESSQGTDGGLGGFLVSARVDDKGVVVFRDGKITAEVEAEDGLKIYELGAYEVNEGRVFINGIMTEPKLEDGKVTLTGDKTVMLLERK